MKRVEEELSDLLMAAVEVRVKKRVKRAGRMEDMGELAIQFGSLEELNGLIERLRAELPRIFRPRVDGPAAGLAPALRARVDSLPGQTVNFARAGPLPGAEPLGLRSQAATAALQAGRKSAVLPSSSPGHAPPLHPLHRLACTHSVPGRVPPATAGAWA